MNTVELKILGILRSMKADILDAFNTNIYETINRMSEEGFSEDEIFVVFEQMRNEKARVLEDLETRINDFKVNCNY